MGFVEIVGNKKSAFRSGCKYRVRSVYKLLINKSNLNAPSLVVVGFYE